MSSLVRAISEAAYEIGVIPYKAIVNMHSPSYQELTVPIEDQIIFTVLTLCIILSFIGLILVFTRKSYSPHQQVKVHNYMRTGTRFLFICSSCLILLSITIYLYSFFSSSFNLAFELNLTRYLVILFFFSLLLLIDFSSVKEAIVQFNKKINYVLIVGFYVILTLIYFLSSLFV